jgi:hypothetical protein
MKPLPEGKGELMDGSIAVERDGLADVIDHDLARVAPGHVGLELGTKCGVDGAVDIVVQQSEQIFAFHHELVTLMWTLHLAKGYRAEGGSACQAVGQGIEAGSAVW